MIVGNMIGGGTGAPKTCLFRTENGEEMMVVLVDSEVVLTASKNDIREGKTAATANGVVTGDKIIPAYHTTCGFRIITAGNPLTLLNTDSRIDSYDYTKLQAIVCAFNIDIDNSVSAEQVCIDDKVYPVHSSESISTVTKNHDTKNIDFGITNDTEDRQIIRYFMYKEIE